MHSEHIYKYVDNSLEYLTKIELMMLPHTNMPEEMMEKTVEKTDDWIPWKAIPSVVTKNDIEELENKTGLKYPAAYKTFLMYKHFYDLDNVNDITFYRHCVRDWKIELLDMYFNSWEPDQIIKKGLIPFANFSDWGIVCFDTNTSDIDNCRIIMLDHETLYDDVIYPEVLYANFEIMILELLKAQKERRE